MRLLVLGAGGVGGYFGGRLAGAGVDVHFLVRPTRAETLARDGLVITSPLGDLHIPVTTRTMVDAPFDAVLLSCKAYDLDDAITAIAPAVGPSTLILPLLNGLRHLDQLDEHFGRDRVLGGLCQIGVSLNGDGTIVHLDTLQRFVFGARSEPPAGTLTALAHLLERGGFAPVCSDNIMQEMWEKFTFLTTYASMTTLMRAPVGAILTATDGESLMHEVLAECIATATSQGFPPRPDAIARMLTALTDRKSRGTASMFRDMTNNGRTEHDHIIGDMLARAQSASVSAPVLRVCFANMQIYETIRRGASA